MFKLKGGDSYMSEFIVKENTIHKILTFIDGVIVFSEQSKFSIFLTELGIDLSNTHWKTQLGQKMWDLNHLSLRNRYGDPKKQLAYQFRPFPCSQIEAFKALECWLYQCATGNIPATSKLFKFFDQVLLGKLAEHIVLRTPEYESAEWG